MLINESAGEKGPNIGNKHAIIWEKFEEHPHPDAQAGRMQIDDVESRTYPRWNFRGGSNTTLRREFCTGKLLKPTFHQSLMISVDSEVFYQHKMAWWIKSKIPGTPEYAFGGPVPADWRKFLALRTACTHANHDYKKRRRTADGKIILSNRLARRKRRNIRCRSDKSQRYLRYVRIGLWACRGGGLQDLGHVGQVRCTQDSGSIFEHWAVLF